MLHPSSISVSLGNWSFMTFFCYIHVFACFNILPTDFCLFDPGGSTVQFGAEYSNMLTIGLAKLVYVFDRISDFSGLIVVL